MDSQKNTQYDFSVVVEPIRFITGSDSVVQSSAERYQHSPTAAVRIYPYLTINGFLYSEFPEYSWLAFPTPCSFVPLFPFLAVSTPAFWWRCFLFRCYVSHFQRPLIFIHSPMIRPIIVRACERSTQQQNSRCASRPISVNPAVRSVPLRDLPLCAVLPLHCVLSCPLTSSLPFIWFLLHSCSADVCSGCYHAVSLWQVVNWNLWLFCHSSCSCWLTHCFRQYWLWQPDENLSSKLLLLLTSFSVLSDASAYCGICCGPVSVCLSVCLSITRQTGWTDGAGFRHEGYFWLIPPCVVRDFAYLQK